MSVYQAADDRWIFFDGENKNFFDTEAEAQSMSKKNTFAEQAQSTSTILAQAITRADSLAGTYFDRGYNSGGGDELLDADVESLGITAADITAFITLAQQLQNFANGDAVTPADYDSTLSKMRTDI